MAGKMAVGTGYIPEFQEPQRQPKKRHASQEHIAAVLCIIVAGIILTGLLLFRGIGYLQSKVEYNAAYERSEELRSEATSLSLQLQSLSGERRIQDMASALGMAEPDPSHVKKVSRKK